MTYFTTLLSKITCDDLGPSFACFNDKSVSGSNASHHAVSSPETYNSSAMICASAVPPSANQPGPSSRVYPPMRRGSASYPELRQTLAPLTVTTFSPRPASISIPSPAHSHHAGFAHSPSFLGTPISLTPTYSLARSSVGDLGANHLLQARADFIEADARSGRRISRARAPARAAISGVTQSRSRSRQRMSRPPSQVGSLAGHPSASPLHPPSVSYPHTQHESASQVETRVSFADSVSAVHIVDGCRAETPEQLSTTVESRSSVSGSPAPDIQLEPPSPEQERRTHARTFSDMMEVSVQSPSTASFPSQSRRYDSPSPVSSHRNGINLGDPTMLGYAASESDEHHLPFKHVTVHESTPLALPPGRTLQEVIPEETPRYTRQLFVPDEACSFTVGRLCINFPHSVDGRDPDLHGWEPMTHSEGCLYFYHREKRIYTEAYLYSFQYMDEVEQLVNYLEKLLATTPETLPSFECELVVQVRWSEDDRNAVVWEYYYVDHHSRAVMWLRPFEVDDYITEVTGPMSPAHFRHLLESWYWDHVATFPNGYKGHDILVDELMGQLTFFSIDHITSPTTTVPYTAEELKTLIKLLGKKDAGVGAVPVAAALGRMMSLFCHWRYIHFHGQRHARLDRHESIHNVSAHRPRSWLMKFFSYAFLFAPEVHLRDIEKLYVDRVILTYTWKRHIVKLQDEWTEFVLYATVMLTANVSVLSVPDVILFPENPSGLGGDSNIQSYLPPLRSPAAIASYVSILCSVGSIVIGLMLVRHNRTKSRDTAGEAINYMYQQESAWFYHEPLAILYSLPYALLMWAMLSFLGSILIFTLVNTDIVTRSTVAAVSFVVSSLIVWCIVAVWEPSERTQKLLQTAKDILMLRWRTQGEETLSSNSIISEKSDTWLRAHSQALAKKARVIKAPCFGGAV